jgi:hypothetical protein
MFSFFFLLFLLFHIKRYCKEPRRMLSIAVDAVIVLLLGSYFLLPLVEQYANARFFSEWHFTNLNPATTAVRIYNLFVTLGPTGFDYTPPIGLTILGILIVWLWVKKRAKTDPEHMRNFSLIAGIICLFMATRYFPYQVLDPLLNMIQFPWRFFLPGTMFFAYAGADMIRDISSQKRWKHTVVTGICLLLCCVQFLCISIPTYVEHSWASVLDTHANLTDTDVYFVMSDENYLNINNTKEYWYYRTAAINISEKGVAATGTKEGDIYTFQFAGNAGRTTVLELPLVYYYGYTAVTQTGQKLLVFPGEHGLAAVTIPEDIDSGTAHIQYTGTKIQRFSPALSTLTGIVLVVVFLVNNRNRGKKRSAAL